MSEHMPCSLGLPVASLDLLQTRLNGSFPIVIVSLVAVIVELFLVKLVTHTQLH